MFFVPSIINKRKICGMEVLLKTQIAFQKSYEMSVLYISPPPPPIVHFTFFKMAGEKVIVRARM